MQKLTVLAKTLVAFTVGLSVASTMSSARAVSLVPQQEGEIKMTNFDCLYPSDPNKCIDTNSLLGYTVTSLPYDFDGKQPQYGLSRLFVDNRDTSNNWGFGIKFGTQDAGTNTPAGEYWFRPVAYLAEFANQVPTTNPTATNKPAENGQLEVGKFQFNFEKTISELTLFFFDTEDGNFTGLKNPDDLLLAGANNNIQSKTLKNVKSFIVQLGKPGPDSKFPKTGDGVALKGTFVVKQVPEPGMVLSLGALAVVGMFGLGQRKKSVPTT
ncbi:MAG: LEVG family PEP-CTERM protein [Fischerella sp.]|nr:LEVG family PEP-CTERM protein [Fischerella sp.]